jgi:glycerol-3-phosphate dehydrogenase (NAD(P)+)
MNAAVIGCGAWGTTLAKVLAENGHQVVIWSHDEAIARDINDNHLNSLLLSGVNLPASITSTCSLEQACVGKSLIVMVVASAFFGDTVKKMIPHIPADAWLLSATKGLNEKTKQRASQVLGELLPQGLKSRVAVLSGPNLSGEISRQKPSATVISSVENDTACAIQGFFNNNYLRVYTNNDVTGTELGGTLKNVIAIAAGIIDGLELGDNAKSAVMVRGQVEITRLALKLGAQSETFYGLAGMGDLIVTCSSTLSRNHFVGENLGRGRKLKDILNDMTAVAEGVGTTRLVYELAREQGVEMPVTEQVYKVLFEDKPVQEAIKDLMNRQTKAEG